MKFPVVHLNGTSAADLLEGYLKAMSKLWEAADALDKCLPNGRDYLAPGGIQVAVAEHTARILKVIDVRKEIETIIENIQEQQEMRERRKK